ncbi:MAG: hypothetical protein EP343_09180 [Deltaproteobacteria bacterium]|nr:MAG: hypothetical protein EP343_09180 [Deltaproteobacteria bacterium]
MNGGDLYAQQKILGHSCVTMTERYAHLRSDYLKDAIGFVEFGQEKEGEVVLMEEHQKALG